VLVFLVAVSLGGLRYWIKNGGARAWDHFKLRVPILGKLGRMIAVSRFCRTLSTLLISGVPIVSALLIVKNVVGNLVVQDAVQRAADNILEGQSIAVPLRRSGQFPPMVTHMIAIGERTGELEAMLSNVAEAYDSEVETTVDTVTALIAPAMIIVLGGAVLVIALGLLLPMASLTQNFGT
jgi:general secretion pathway protein F